MSRVKKFLQFPCHLLYNKVRLAPLKSRACGVFCTVYTVYRYSTFNCTAFILKALATAPSSPLSAALRLENRDLDFEAILALILISPSDYTANERKVKKLFQEIITDESE